MDYDVIIVGGRVAGAVLATRLGELGHSILVLEKADFPSDTLSTSFFRAPAMRVFEKIGMLDEVKAAAPPMTTLWNNIEGKFSVTRSKRRKNIYVSSSANAASHWTGSFTNASSVNRPLRFG
jgi:2-polyprenyl-6-methoxyphenol hydroxylase-like FAD-dependent oxidoreductase